MSYNLNYDGERPEQIGPLVPLQGQPPQLEVFRPRSRLRIPGFVKTAFTMGMVAGVFFAAEAYAPSPYKPSTIVGTYEGRIEAAVRASQFQQQAEFDAWIEEVKLVNAQNQQQYQAATQASLAYYQASYERARVFAQATAQMQGVLTQAQIALTNRTQRSESGLVDFIRGVGRVVDVLSPGSGKPALDYADGLTREMAADLNAAAQRGITLSIEDWDTNLPSPQAVQAELASIQPRPLPARPEFRAAPSLAQGEDQ